ncbi:MAG: Fe-S cluster assembly protein SufD [Gemmatimonadota bacterium]
MATAHLTGHEPGSLQRRRATAWEEFGRHPMPTRKLEEWRYTDISGLDVEAYHPLLGGPGAENGGAPKAAIPAAVQAVLDNGQARSAVMVQDGGRVVHTELDPELKDMGVLFAPLLEVLESHPELIERYLFASSVGPAETKLWALHSATVSDGYVLHVPAGVTIPDPVHVLRHLSTPEALVSTHSLIITESGASVTCVDEYLSPDLEPGSLSLNGTEIFGAENASVNFISLQRYGSGVKHFSMQHANTRRDSRLSGFNVTLGGDLARSDVTSHLEGEAGSSEMLALWFGDGSQHFDHHTLQHHAAAHAHSDLLYKGALTGGARSVFRGLIRVDPDAQLTDAYQTNRNLLLSDDASATSLPNLEIEADDVRCSHGATVGQVDDAQMFYLMSRGLNRKQAERLLVFGFFEEVLGRVPVDGIRERVRQAIEEKIGL